MTMDERNTKRDLVLAPSEYAFMQDVTKGIVKTYTGPTVINPTAQERPVRFDKKGHFEPCSLEAAVQPIAIAPEGHYLELKNPVAGSDSKMEHPPSGGVFPAPDLAVGRKVNITGPCSFPLWPGQMVKLVKGHHLRSNQYLIVRIYNEDEARRNWGQAVVKPVEGDAKTVVSKVPADLTVGKLILIKGTDVSFYIPPTGVSVVPDEENQYVREALTLERLDYCILVDENGNKRFERGPQVVFPQPSERFISKDEHTKYRALELNEIQGIHIKVIADYEEKGADGKTVAYKVGDELFITGKETAIYFPREEHSIVRYDGKDKHFAVAIPRGEARYVMNRKTGEIRMVMGEAMLLCDPRTEVIVRRVLSDKECMLYYPGNEDVLEYNRTLRKLSDNSPTTRGGAVTEGEIARNSRTRGPAAGGMRTLGAADKGGSRDLIASAVSYNAVAAMESSAVSSDQRMVAEEFSRQSTYTQPRTITLENKYHGVPMIDVWTGHAVMVVSKSNSRRVVVGPQTIHLAYDEKLMQLGLSTGKPKNTDKIHYDVYLRTLSNKISDIVEVETSDHVTISLKFSYCVDFVGEEMKWFAIDNYVKHLCDHLRSILKGTIRRLPVEEFYHKATDIIRDLLLGTKKDEIGKRTGMTFPQNGMTLTDVEVLGVDIKDERIKSLLNNAQHATVQASIALANTRRDLETQKVTLDINGQLEKLKSDAQLAREALARQVLESELATSMLKATTKLKEIAAQMEQTVKIEEIKTFESSADLERRRAEELVTYQDSQRNLELTMTQLKAETEAAVERFGAAQAGFSEALLSLSNNETLGRIAESLSLQRAIGGESVVDAFSKIFAGTPLEALGKKLLGRTLPGSNNGIGVHAES